MLICTSWFMENLLKHPRCNMPNCSPIIYLHSLNSVYFTNSGAEAVEGAMKLAKRVTNRTRSLHFNNSYHGSTQGALSIMGSEYWRNAFRPLLPGIIHHDYSSFDALNEITEQTACVIAETVQAEAGIIAPSASWMQALRKKCTETGSVVDTG